ncbi:MAG: hypothetical protein ACFB15_00770 [Cyclobacteriaceae bacterium]
MRIAFVTNEILTEYPSYTTVHLTFQAMKMGHEAYLTGVGELAYLLNGHMGGTAFRMEERVESPEVMLQEMQESDGHDIVDTSGPKIKRTNITSETLDVLFIRNDPQNLRGAFR